MSFREKVKDFLFGDDIKPEKTENEIRPGQDINRQSIVVPPGGRSSEPDNRGSLLSNSVGLLEFSGIIEPDIYPQIIPVIRTLVKVNSDMSIAANDMVKLINTGYRVSFDNSIDKNKARRMVDHINQASIAWGKHNGGMFGLVNKMIMQSFISGAISIEAVIKKDKTGIDFISFVKPETIRFKREKDSSYSPYQISQKLDRYNGGYIKLNPITYMYTAVNGDEDLPYGIPPFLSALESISAQKDMKTNIYNVMQLMGILGYLSTLIEKPNKEAYESESDYKTRLDSLLRETRRNIGSGLKDGLLVGYMDDHEYEFNSTTASLQNVTDVYNLNQLGVANGLNVAPGIIGLEGNSKTEGGTSIMFSKLLSQLKNLQYFASYTIKRLFWLELVLNGFDPKGLKVEFNKSTITDELKYQQAQEIKLRNLVILYDQGIIGQQTFAEETGFEVPDKKEPRVSREESSTSDAESKAEREKSKDTSDRRSREKDKAVPKRGDGNTKPV